MIESYGRICCFSIPRTITRPACAALHTNTLPFTRDASRCHVTSSRHVTLSRHVTSSRNAASSQTQTLSKGSKRNVVVTKLSASTMIKLRSLQLLSHATIVGLSTASLSSLVYHLVVSYQTATPHVASLNASTGLSILSAVLLCCPLYISCVVGRLEYNRFNHSIKLSYLDLFAERCEMVGLAQECTISRESKICRLADSRSFVIFWKNTVEEAAENISILSAEGSRDRKNNRPGVGQGYQFRERLYIAVICSIFVASTSLFVKHLFDSGQIDAWFYADHS